MIVPTEAVAHLAVVGNQISDEVIRLATLLRPLLNGSEEGERIAHALTGINTGIGRLAGIIQIIMDENRDTQKRRTIQ